ncbi:MAG: enolase C-terminal domain-like protein [Dehalococcoidia bacterium]
MKIAKIKATALALRDQPLLNSTGIHKTHAVRTLVQLETDEGFTGVGEAGGDHVEVVESNLDWLIGADALNITRARLQFQGGRPDAWTTVETAMLDAGAKKFNLPLCDYIGGRARDRVEWAAYLFYKLADENGRGEVATGDTLTPEAYVKQAEEFVEKYGFRELKIKGGFFHPDVDIETFRLLRQRFPKSGGYEIRIDPNANWSVDTAIRVAKAIEPYEPQYLEDPVGPQEQMAELRHHTPIPLSTNMCVSAFSHVKPAVKKYAIDVVLGDHHHWGGILAYKETGVLCRVLGWGLSGHSNNSFGVSQAAMLHAYAATPELAYGADSHYPWTDTDGDIIKGGKLQFKDGFMEVPEMPGLGVEVDQDKVDEFAEIYQSGGIKDRAEMVRSLDPLWPASRPRW